MSEPPASTDALALDVSRDMALSQDVLSLVRSFSFGDHDFCWYCLTIDFAVEGCWLLNTRIFEFP
jgi:hypothetical protein